MSYGTRRYLVTLQGCPNPVLEGPNPAGFSVLAAKENELPGKSVVCVRKPG